MERPNIIIYILCFNIEIYEQAIGIYGSFYWAKPCLMKYQDITMENAFWKQLLEIKDEWVNCEMVGVLSWRAFLKLDINAVDKIIIDREAWLSEGYYHFLTSNDKLLDDNFHPHIQQIMQDIKNLLNLKLPEYGSYCNYFMCTPDKMTGFIHWNQQKIVPAVLLHHLSFENAFYCTGYNEEQCLNLWGLPYYTHVPFAIERLNPSYFHMQKFT